MVTKKILFFFASFVWFFASTILLFRGFSSLTASDALTLPAILIITVSGLIFYMLLFKRVSTKIITRLRALPGKRARFYSFFSLRSYLMMFFMISFGIGLKHTGLLPELWFYYFLPVMAIPLLVSSIRFCINGIQYTTE